MYRAINLSRPQLSRPSIPSNLAFIVADTAGQRLVLVMSLLVRSFSQNIIIAMVQYETLAFFLLLF